MNTSPELASYRNSSASLITGAGRIGSSEEMADVIRSLASRRASSISGRGMVVEGGYTIQ